MSDCRPGHAARRDRPRHVVDACTTTCARPARRAGRRLQPEPEGRRGRLPPGRGADPPEPRRRSTRPSATAARCRAAAAGSRQLAPATVPVGNSTAQFAGRRHADLGDRRLGPHPPHHRERSAAAQASAADLAERAAVGAGRRWPPTTSRCASPTSASGCSSSRWRPIARSLQIVQNQFDAGIASQLDVAQAQTQLDQTRAQLVAEGVNRAAVRACDRRPDRQGAGGVQHRRRAACARGRADVDAGMPSALLERRPDIAVGRAADGRGQCADRRRGGGLLSRHHAHRRASASPAPCSRNLFSLANSVWSLGPQLAGTADRRRRARARRSRARAPNYDRTVATYRQTVLTAFQQVEDALAQQRILEQQEDVQRAARRRRAQGRAARRSTSTAPAPCPTRR